VRQPPPSYLILLALQPADPGLSLTGHKLVNGPCQPARCSDLLPKVLGSRLLWGRMVGEDPPPCLGRDYDHPWGPWFLKLYLYVLSGTGSTLTEGI
jgi:hypothetical protein